MSDPERGGSQTAVRDAPEKELWKNASDHAWKYFELHANQRMTVFNFFTVLAGLVVAGIAATMQGDSRFSILGVALGGVLTLLAFVFWKLDQRGAFLVKRAETVQTEVEQRLLPAEARLFASEPSSMKSAQAGQSPLTSLWTFGTSFRLMFVVVAIIGIASSAICALRVAGLVSWEDKPRESARSESPVTPSVQKPADKGLAARKHG